MNLRKNYITCNRVLQLKTSEMFKALNVYRARQYVIMKFEKLSSNYSILYRMPYN